MRARDIVREDICFRRSKEVAACGVHEQVRRPMDGRAKLQWLAMVEEAHVSGESRVFSRSNF